MPGELVRVGDVQYFEAQRRYSYVIFGGTFDRIHDGHRALFKATIELVRDGGDVEVGLSADELLQHKKNVKLIRDYDERLANVTAELQKLNTKNKQFSVKVTTIRTKEGVAHTVPYTQACIVVSEETLEAAQKINETRSRSGLEQLDIAVIPLLRNNRGDILSSTFLRQQEACNP